MNVALLAMAAALSLVFGVVNYLIIQSIILMVAGGLGVWLMTHRISAANAAPITKETAQAKQTISNFLGGGSASIKSMEAMLRKRGLLPPEGPPAKESGETSGPKPA